MLCSFYQTLLHAFVIQCKLFRSHYFITTTKFTIRTLTNTSCDTCCTLFLMPLIHITHIKWFHGLNVSCHYIAFFNLFCIHPISFSFYRQYVFVFVCVSFFCVSLCSHIVIAVALAPEMELMCVCIHGAGINRPVYIHVLHNSMFNVASRLLLQCSVNVLHTHLRTLIRIGSLWPLL